MALDTGRLFRIARATAIVAAIAAVGGAIGGAIVGAGVMIYAGLAVDGAAARSWRDFLELCSVTAPIGAIYGIVLGPLYTWTLLRRAPLWRAIGETALGAALGVGIGTGLVVFSRGGIAQFVMPVVLSAVAAVRLRFELRRRDERASLPREHSPTYAAAATRFTEPSDS